MQAALIQGVSAADYRISSEHFDLNHAAPLDRPITVARSRPIKGARAVWSAETLRESACMRNTIEVKSARKLAAAPKNRQTLARVANVQNLIEKSLLP